MGPRLGGENDASGWVNSRDALGSCDQDQLQLLIYIARPPSEAINSKRGPAI